MIRLKGLIAAPFTPFADNGELALDKIKDFISLYEENDVRGAFVGGTTGEGVSLTFEEKKLLMETWGREKSEAVKVLFMLGGNCQKEMQELASLAIDYKMDGISILPPFYFKPASEEDLVEFCGSIADEVPELPFYYYHIPGLTGVNLNMFQFLQIADKKIANLAGVKFSNLNVMDFQNCVDFQNQKYNILWGVDEALLSGLVVGAEGAVGSTYNYAAPLYYKVIQYYNDGNMEMARKWQHKAVKMVDLLIKFGGIGAGKAFMKIIGLDCGNFRPPIINTSKLEIENLKQKLIEEDFFNYASKF